MFQRVCCPWSFVKLTFWIDTVYIKVKLDTLDVLNIPDKLDILDTTGILDTLVITTLDTIKP